MSTPVITTEQARELDQQAIHELAIPGIVLMENAARNMAELLVSLGATSQVLILCGRGNNGGDGLAMARHLDRLGFTVAIRLYATLDQLTAEAATHWTIAERCDFPRRLIDPDQFDPAALEADLRGATWVVDALFGSGLKGPLRAPFDAIVATVNGARKAVFAVDVPSGFDADAGVPLGPCIRATHTAVTIASRVGFSVPGASEWLGQVHIVDIGLPRGLVPGS
jgi:NAD(P)H-hydrate epimerase